MITAIKPEAGGELLLEDPATLPNLVLHTVLILFFKPEEREPASEAV